MPDIPTLNSLPSHFCKLKWSLHKTSNSSTHHSSKHNSVLSSKKHVWLLEHELIIFPLRVKCFVNCKLHWSIYDRSNELRDDASIKSSNSFVNPHILDNISKADLFHILMLSLHLCLDRIHRMAYYCISSSIKDPTNSCKCKFLCPMSSLVLMCHN